MKAKPWWLLLLLPAIPLWAVFKGDAIGPWEQIRQMAPWYGPAPNQPWDVLQADGALQFYVWRDLVFEAWSQFQLPAWNPYELAGTPLMANSQSAALYPPHVLLGVFHVPTSAGLALLAWLHLALAALGVYRLARALGASESGGLVAGASFGLSPFLVSWTALASVITTVAWIPWALALTAECLPLPDQARPNKTSYAGLALCVGMMFLAGHLQFAAYGCIAIFLVAVFRFASGWPNLGRFALACLGGLLICSPQLVPVLKYGEFSHRRGSPTEEGYAAYVASALKPWQIGTLVNPIGLGNPREFGQNANVSSYWPALVKRGDNFAESALSPGPVAVAFLCLLPFFWRSLKGVGGVVAVGVAGALLAFGTPLARAMYFGIPGWSSTGSPGRAIVLFVLAACVLAGLAAGALFDPATRPKTPRPIQLGALVFVFVTAISVSLGTGGAVPPPGVDEESFKALVGSTAAQALFTTIFLAAVAVQPAFLGYFRAYGPRSAPLALGPLAVAVCALIAGAHAWVMTGKVPPMPDRASLAGEYGRVAFVNENWELTLAVIPGVPPPIMPPNLASLARIHELGGYDSILHRETVKMLHEVSGKDSAPLANGNMMFVKPSATSEALAEAGVTMLLTPSPNPRSPGQPVNFDQLAVAGPGRASVEGRAARVVGESFSSVSVEAEGPGRLTLRDRYMPGWSATVDGTSVELPERRWMEVELPAGPHRVEFHYSPPGFSPLIWLGLPALLAALGVIALPKTRRPAAKKPAEAEAPEETPVAA